MWHFVGGGCALFWISKWVITSILTGNNIFIEALTEAGRVAGSDNTVNTQYLYVLVKNAAGLLPSEGHDVIPMAAIFFLFVIILLIILLKRRRNDLNYGALIPLIVVGLLPFAWYFVFRKHSSVHALLYGYRSLIVPIFLFFSVCFYCIDSR